MEIRTFRDLVAWQKAMRLVEEIYHATAAMPEHERYGLTAQLRRAAVSVPSNIAEGYGRQSLPDYQRFLRTARGSLMELQTQLLLSERLGLLPASPTRAALVEEADRVLQGLIRSLGSCRAVGGDAGHV